jgi:hypothetical protein
MATKGTEELPRNMRTRCRGAPPANYRPIPSAALPPTEWAYKGSTATSRWIVPESSEGSTITLQDRRPYRSLKVVALPRVHVVLAEVSAVAVPSK